MLELNPAIVDQDKIRKAKRKQFFLIAALPCTTLLLVGLFFLRTSFFNVGFSLAYENSNFTTANTLSDSQKFANLISPYIAHFNSGVVNIQKADYQKAEADFRESLKNNPPSSFLCNIYVNLSFSIERQADEYVKSERHNDALVLYSNARAILDENNCISANEDNKSSDKKASEAEKRIDAKRNRVIAQMNSQDVDDNDDNEVVKPLTEDQITDIQSDLQVPNTKKGGSSGGSGSAFGGGSSSGKYPW